MILISVWRRAEGRWVGTRDYIEDLIATINILLILIIIMMITRDGDDHCHGELSDFSTLLSPAARAATVFTGIAVEMMMRTR